MRVSSLTSSRTVPPVDAPPFVQGRWIGRLLTLICLATALAIVAINCHSPPAASGESEGSYVASVLESIRAQIDLYRVQHSDHPPPPSAMWTALLHASNTAGVTTLGTPTPQYPFGPYLRAAPVNPANFHTLVAASPQPGAGWIYTVNGSDYTFSPINARATAPSAR